MIEDLHADYCLYQRLEEAIGEDPDLKVGLIKRQSRLYNKAQKEAARSVRDLVMLMDMHARKNADKDLLTLSNRLMSAVNKQVSTHGATSTA